MFEKLLGFKAKFSLSIKLYFKVCRKEANVFKMIKNHADFKKNISLKNKLEVNEILSIFTLFKIL